MRILAAITPKRAAAALFAMAALGAGIAPAVLSATATAAPAASVAMYTRLSAHNLVGDSGPNMYFD